MPVMEYQPRTINDRSSLTEGWHPAFLLAIEDEATPDTWQMFAQSPRMWRWKFAVWATPEAIAQTPPERQSAPSSQKFTPKGRQPASKAYSWTVALLGRQIPPGEAVNLDPSLPLPCRVKVERSQDYANIKDIEMWSEGTQYLTPTLRTLLQQLIDEAGPSGVPTQPPQSLPPSPPTPAMTQYGGTTAQPIPPGPKQGW